MYQNELFPLFIFLFFRSEELGPNPDLESGFRLVSSPENYNSIYQIVGDKKSVDLSYNVHDGGNFEILEVGSRSSSHLQDF
jgi:hypothetical protein